MVQYNTCVDDRCFHPIDLQCFVLSLVAFKSLMVLYNKCIGDRSCHTIDLQCFVLRLVALNGTVKQVYW